jgi:hypothetical protein
MDNRTAYVGVVLSIDALHRLYIALGRDQAWIDAGCMGFNPLEYVGLKVWTSGVGLCIVALPSSTTLNDIYDGVDTLDEARTRWDVYEADEFNRWNTTLAPVLRKALGQPKIVLSAQDQ